MILPEDYLERSGYRLPTRVEWEQACRCGSISPLSIGSFLSPADTTRGTQPTLNHVCTPRGNSCPIGWDCSICTVNAFEWCAGVYLHVPKIGVHETAWDVVGPLTLNQELFGVLKGGDFPANHPRLRSAYQEHPLLTHSWPASGLRVAKTMHVYPMVVYCTIITESRRVWAWFPKRSHASRTRGQSSSIGLCRSSSLLCPRRMLDRCRQLRVRSYR